MYYLIADYGTSSCRASLVDADGKITAFCRKPAAVYSSGSAAEINPDTAWKTLAAAIRELLEQNPAADIAAVGVSSLLGWVFLDKHGSPVGPSMIWADKRGSRALESSVADDMDAVYRKTGRRLSRELMISKWAWLKENRPDAANAAATVISLKDEFVRRLTGAVLTDVAHMNYTMLWDIRNSRADSELLELAGIAHDMLAPAVYPFDRAGVVTAEAAAATGLIQGLPVVAGSIDGTTAMYGGGMSAAGTAVMVSGTTDVLMMLTEAYPPAISGTGNILTVNNGLVPGTFAVGGSTGSSGGALMKMCELLDGDTGRLLKDAESLPPGADGLLFSPGLTGERAPYWDAGITGGFIGLQPEHSGAHIVRAVMEGAALRLKRLSMELFDTVEKTSGRKPFGQKTSGNLPAVVNILGGGAGIDCWNRIKADTTGLTFCRPVETEATTLGTAMYCECCLNKAADLVSVAKNWVKPDIEYPAESANYEIYNRLFNIYESFLAYNKENHTALSSFKRV